MAKLSGIWFRTDEPGFEKVLCAQCGAPLFIGNYENHEVYYCPAHGIIGLGEISKQIHPEDIS